MNYIEIKKVLEDLSKNNHKEFVKGLISFEKGVNDEEILNRIYEEYMNNDEIELLSSNISNRINGTKEIKEAKQTKNDYWVIEFNETDSNFPLSQKSYKGEKVTKKLLDEIKVLDEEISTNYLVNSITNDFTGLLKFYFDHIVDDKVTEHIRIDIGSGNQINAPEFAKLEEHLYKDKQQKGYYLTGNVVGELKYIKNEKVDVCNFVICSLNPDTKEKKYTYCSAYNDKKELLNDLKEGDYVRLLGVYKSTIQNDKRYTNFNINALYLLNKNQEVAKSEEKTNLNEHKENSIDKPNEIKNKIFEVSERDLSE